MDTPFTETLSEVTLEYFDQRWAGAAHQENGLSENEARERRARGLGNKVKLKTGRTHMQILRENLFTFFNLVLFGLGIALVILDKPIEALITSGVVLVNVVLALVQELRAKRKLDKIALLTRPRVTAIRDGHEKQIDPSEVVLGDVLVVGVGDQIVVDGTVIGDGRMNVDESLLTGEADLIAKQVGDQVYSGSFCVAGSARYIAEKVGLSSVVNKLAVSARTYHRRYTPLQKEVNLIIRVLLGVVVFFLTLNIITTILQKSTIIESIRAASVLFGLTPSSLFLMIVVAYAWGAVRIAGKGALVQQANSVESLCNVTVLCLDKTAGSLDIQATCGLDPAYAAQIRMPLGVGTAGRALAERRPVVISDTAEAAAYLHRLAAPLEGLRVTRLARGLPVGGDLEYADGVTIAEAFSGRREM